MKDPKDMLEIKEKNIQTVVEDCNDVFDVGDDPFISYETETMGDDRVVIVHSKKGNTLEFRVVG